VASGKKLGPFDVSQTLRSRLLWLGLATLGLALYLWPAFAAPVVLWSDSEIDLAWAREGLGIFRSIPPPAPGVPISHLPKPFYLLFLRGATRACPWVEEARSVVVAQSALLALSIVATSSWLARRRGAPIGLLFSCLCFLFLRLRDAASAVMPEALAAAFLLPITAMLLDPPKSRWAAPLTGLAAAVLFLIRPNCGGLVLLIGVMTFAIARSFKSMIWFLAGFALLALLFWYIGRSNLPGDPLHGLGFQIVEGSADYYWAPSVDPWPAGRTPSEASKEQIRVARERWVQTLAKPDPDRRRQLIWRSLHGLFGVEYYDSRWSRAYAELTTASRLASPFVILAAVALVLVSPWRFGKVTKTLGLFLLGLILAQNLLLGSNPRYVLPFLPVLFLFGLCSASPQTNFRAHRRLIFAGVLGLLIFAVRWQLQILDWQWGRIESAGVTLRQTIPRGALPSYVPATLHVRLATPLPESGAHWTLSISGKPILEITGNGKRRSPVITVELPSWALEESRRGALEIVLRSTGSYDNTSYILFPVIPPPWSHEARRDGSEDLSPATGVRRGALDWWVHRGVD